ncbi:hypothetical protein KUH03_14690 [Sphingobacterium sp. E70]|uniref:hypothetical protein n=1 Tax=Sphingobacterium sp. E70 TaxID=2853439 RepID=UPI00211CBFE6|nr:hypothetical protein [Sphingobacterium sp. E70]ULT27787.1 hypothetical protein KUH03_14690 [Sphingobacterium sp. E70]
MRKPLTARGRGGECVRTEIAFGVQLKKDSNANWVGTFESPMQTSLKFPINTIKTHEDSISMDVKAIGYRIRAIWIGIKM